MRNLQVSGYLRLDCQTWDLHIFALRSFPKTSSLDDLRHRLCLKTTRAVELGDHSLTSGYLGNKDRSCAKLAMTKDLSSRHKQNQARNTRRCHCQLSSAKACKQKNTCQLAHANCMFIASATPQGMGNPDRCQQSFFRLRHSTVSPTKHS